MTSLHTPQSLVASAMALLRAIGEGESVDTKLLSWIELVQTVGFERACRQKRRLAGKFSDWMVTDAIDVITVSTTRWPRRNEKVELVAQILSDRITKAEIRLIASLGFAPP